MYLLALLAIVLYPQAKIAWAVIVVGMVLLFRFGLRALPYFAVGLIARHVAMQRALRAGEPAGTPLAGRADPEP